MRTWKMRVAAALVGVGVLAGTATGCTGVWYGGHLYCAPGYHLKTSPGNSPEAVCVPNYH